METILFDPLIALFESTSALFELAIRCLILQSFWLTCEPLCLSSRPFCLILKVHCITLQSLCTTLKVLSLGLASFSLKLHSHCIAMKASFLAGIAPVLKAHTRSRGAVWLICNIYRKAILFNWIGLLAIQVKWNASGLRRQRACRYLLRIVLVNRVVCPVRNSPSGHSLSLNRSWIYLFPFSGKTYLSWVLRLSPNPTFWVSRRGTSRPNAPPSTN